MFAVTAIPAALGADSLNDIAVGVALVSFAVSLVVWLYAFGVGIARSGRGDNVAVSNLFFLQGSAPRVVQWHLLGSLGVSLAIAAATAAHNPFGVLVPMLPLAFAGLWAARHGTFPPRGANVTAGERRTSGRAGA